MKQGGAIGPGSCSPERVPCARPHGRWLYGAMALQHYGISQPRSFLLAPLGKHVYSDIQDTAVEFSEQHSGLLCAPTRIGVWAARA